MFRMEFQSVDGVEEANSGSRDDITESVYERYRDVGCSSQRPAIFEGRVGRFGKVQRVSTSASCNATGVTGCRSWTEADLMHFDAPSLQGVTQDEDSQHAIFFDAQVLRELVRPFVELPSEAHVAADMETESMSCGSDSMRSTSSCGSDSSSSASEGSIAEMDALQRANKPWEEPLVALQQQTEVNKRAQKEAKRLAEEEWIESVRKQRELRDLANCVGHDVSPTWRAFKRNKLQKVLNKTGITAVCRFLKNPFRVFKSRKIYDGYLGAAQGVNAVVMPRRAKGAFFPSETATADAALAQMRAAPRKARSQIQFETVHSTQRDVEAWTMEEYMTRNARLHKWNRKEDDEDFGGIEGNNLMNQYFDDDVGATYDSDSD